MGRALSILLLVVLSVLHHAYTQPQVQLSLEGGSDSNSGRVVLIWDRSTRGTICSDGFDNNDAAVICRILGKNPNGAVYTSTFGPGTGTIVLSRLECRGHEQDLLECPVGRWGQQTGCHHSQDVGVVCGGSSPSAPTPRPTQRPTQRPNPTPRPGGGCRDGFLARPNTVGFNAGRFPALTTTACSDACLTSFPTCYGYDWRGACYLYLNSSNPNNLQVGTGTNYERIFSCRTLAPPANAPGFCRDRFITYQIQYVVGGAFVQTSSTQDCANKCLQSSLPCYGYGIWDKVWCFLVLYTHSQSDVRVDTRWTRYQHVFTCQGSSPGPTPMPTPPPRPIFTPSPRPASVQAFLVNGPDYLHGRVVLQDNGENGTVCDDFFGYNDARVICRMLGYFGSDVSVGVYKFGPGPSTMRIWLDNVACTGNERDISSCAHRGWGVHNCDHAEDVSVLCGPRIIRDPLSVYLEGGSDRLHGRLIVTYNNQPGTVCKDNFGTNDARVICRMLGYRGSIISVTDDYGPGSGRIWLDNVFCHGNESSISDCFYPPLGTHDCRHSEDIGINCGPISISLQVFLVGGQDRLHGRVVVQYNGVNGTVCDDGFGYNDARVICGMLGYFGSDVSAAGDTFGAGSSSMRIWLDNLACRGTERSISTCSHRGWSRHDCDHTEDVSVVCGRRLIRDPPVSVTLEGGSDRLHGRLIVRYYGQPGTVCDDNFGTNDARVICRMLGYRGSSVAVTRRYGQGSGRIWLDDVFCHGNESSISDCFYPPLGTHDCDHSEDVGISCGPTSVPPTTAAPPTTSVTFTLEASGRVALQLSGIRGYICSDGFGLNDARVICRTFAQPSTNAQIRNFPHTSGIVWLTNVQCTGFESIIDQCRFDAEVGITNCRSRQNIGVVCGTSQVLTTSTTRPPGPAAVCGTRYSSKIFGGTVSSPGAWPWVASLTVLTVDSMSYCGAAVIAPQWVITAAHCIDSVSMVQVVVGTNNRNQGGVRVSVTRITIHPQYSSTLYDNDVALIRLQQPLTYSTMIRPICLNTVSGIPSTECYVAGWGRTRAGGDVTTLLWSASLPIVSDSLCSRFPSFNGQVMLCAGVRGGTRDVCAGDSGGPLMCRRPGSSVYDLWGLVTGGAPCGTLTSTYGFYVDVAQYVTWINTIINS